MFKPKKPSTTSPPSEDDGQWGAMASSDGSGTPIILDYDQKVFYRDGPMLKPAAPPPPQQNHHHQYPHKTVRFDPRVDDPVKSDKQKWNIASSGEKWNAGSGNDDGTFKDDGGGGNINSQDGLGMKLTHYDGFYGQLQNDGPILQNGKIQVHTNVVNEHYSELNQRINGPRKRANGGVRTVTDTKPPQTVNPARKVANVSQYTLAQLKKAGYVNNYGVSTSVNVTLMAQQGVKKPPMQKDNHEDELGARERGVALCVRGKNVDEVKKEQLRTHHHHV